MTHRLKGTPMSDPTTNGGPAVSASSLVWAIVTMFAVTVAASVALAVFLPETAATTLVGALLAAFALLITNLGTLFKIGKVEASVQETKAQVQETSENTARIVQQTNGNLDRRIRELSYDSVRKALTDHLEEEDPSPGARRAP